MPTVRMSLWSLKNYRVNNAFSCPTNRSKHIKQPSQVSEKAVHVLPDGNRTIYDYQLVIVLTSSFTSGSTQFDT